MTEGIAYEEPEAELEHAKTADSGTVPGGSCLPEVQ